MEVPRLKQECALQWHGAVAVEAALYGFGRKGTAVMMMLTMVTISNRNFRVIPVPKKGGEAEAFDRCPRAACS